MTLPVKSAATGVDNNADLNALRRHGDGSLESEKARLRKATREFESYFLYQMLKTMRQTIPDGSQAGSNILSDGLGKDTFTDLFDMEISRKGNFGGHSSISELMYRSMEKLVETQFEQRPDEVPIKPLNAATADPIKLNMTALKPVQAPTVGPMPLKKPAVIRPQAPISPVVKTRKTGSPPAAVAPETRPEKADSRPLMVALTVKRQLETDPIRARFGHLIDQAAKETNLDSTLISSVIRAESSGNPSAVSPSGAKGLMQLADSTAQELEVSDPFDPAQNIRAGSRYLRRMLDRFGDLELALAAYNAGPGNVARYDGVPPFEETRDYVRKITEAMEADLDK